jgi:hypothetical protein
MPTKPDSPEESFSAADLAARTIHRRALEAVIWGIPAVNFDLMFQLARCLTVISISRQTTIRATRSCAPL